MNYIIKGRLSGLVCDACAEPLSNVTVLIYRPADAHLVARAAASPKDTFTIVPAGEVARRQGDLIAQVQTDSNGSFTFVLTDGKPTEKQKGQVLPYDGGAFEIDVRCTGFPRVRPTREGEQVVQFSITTLQPQWRGEETRTWAWTYVLSQRYWCRVRELMGAWTICGQVLDKTTQTPIAGLTVNAFDADWLQDDALGTAVTGSDGRFRINYVAEDFQKTIFPGISFEIAGPDVYFTILSALGTPVYTEAQNDGRAPDRENRFPCFCVTLQVDGSKVPPGQTTSVTPLFTNVGDYKIENPGKTIDESGLAMDSAGLLAFTGSLSLIGLKPNGSDPVPMEYRFTVAPTVYNPSLGAYVPGTFTPVDATLIPATAIGQLEFWTFDTSISQWRIAATDYWLNNPGAPPVTITRGDGTTFTATVNVNSTADGWVAVPREADFVQGGGGQFVAGEVLAGLDTTKLTSESFNAAAPTLVVAGAAIPSPLATTGHPFAIRFEARNASTNAAISSNTLNPITLTNTSYFQIRHPSWAGGPTTASSILLLDAVELAPAMAGCSRIGATSTGLHVLYSVYHPFLDAVGITFNGNAPLPAAITASVANGSATSGTGGVVVDTSMLHPCAYVMWISATLNITNGSGRPQSAFLSDYIAFCVG
jgi:hypothetical protein